MRIISETPDASVTKEHVCKNCGCKFEYVPSDTTEEYLLILQKNTIVITVVVVILTAYAIVQNVVNALT